jgi:hypothetical protein
LAGLASLLLTTVLAYRDLIRDCTLRLYISGLGSAAAAWSRDGLLDPRKVTDKEVIASKCYWPSVPAYARYVVLVFLLYVFMCKLNARSRIVAKPGRQEVPTFCEILWFFVIYREDLCDMLRSCFSFTHNSHVRETPPVGCSPVLIEYSQSSLFPVSAMF